MSKSASPAAHVFAAALMGGLTIALVTQVVLARHGIVMAGMWRTLFVASQAQLRSALAWWTIAFAAFVGGFVVAFLMSRFAWLYLRFLRSWLAAGATFALAVMAREVPAADDIGIAGHVGTNAAAMIVAGIMSSFGSFFALRR